ncbi:carbamoyltransferase HypF [Microbulbifer sediminum]|uniref:carbamoyltransferase HypF n=1 Tax=Microbulbifer sediminum TaxID=2904250 RepID=UPI001F002DDD|nr:carbamoyltransferase HypF [Microbulbifer sediminum]
MNPERTERLRVEVGGLVQGVGFRPFAYQLAYRCDISGWIANDTRGVQMEIQGRARRVREFLQRLQQERPPHARIDDLAIEAIPLLAETGFTIRDSDRCPSPSAIILPDLAPCADCLGELSDPTSRRFGYPFINCTHCGPRFSIIARLPYDRPNTAMQAFPLCDDCRREYVDPQDRRFHAEPNACARCGPQLQLCDRHGNVNAGGATALQQAVAAIQAGQIVAIKGVGGFQLLADASNTETVCQLRDRKQRPHKPFALLYPNLVTVQRDCRLSGREAELLSGPERPILLLAALEQDTAHIVPEVAPGNPLRGVMLPASPLHHLLMQALERPVVATSGNLAGEPICTENSDALVRLGKIADLFLWHNRRILRPVDDSVVRIINGQPVMIRRARGYAPLPLKLPSSSASTECRVALGADLKNCVAVARGTTVHLSQHIGDLQDRVGLQAFERAIADLLGLYELEPMTLLCDLHPGYTSTRWAEQSGRQKSGVQHHVAHFFSCMAEHAYRGPALGICWDGTGYGTDGTLRGGEFLLWDGGHQVAHFGSLRKFRLPGGDRAIREPHRAAAGLLFEMLGREAFSQSPLRQQFKARERHNLARMLERNINSPWCSSIGRLFDVAAALLGLSTRSSFEGQAAMAVEHAAQDSVTTSSYPHSLCRLHDRWLIDWEPTISALLQDTAANVPVADRAAMFHTTLARMAQALAHKAGTENVFLSGGVFQNRRLTETVVRRLEQDGFRVHCHSAVPPNDGGIALGQLYYAQCMAQSGVKIGEGGALCV